MIPKFISGTDMVGFLRALPENADYQNMLKSDFGIDAPENAAPFHMEYYYKYLVQGRYLGKQDDELRTYAYNKVLKFAEDFPHVIQKFVPNERVIEKPRAYRKSADAQGMHGVIVWNEKFGKYDGYVNGKVVTRASSAEKCNQTMVKKHGVEGALQGE
jgi:hypothetical protein